MSSSRLISRVSVNRATVTSPKVSAVSVAGTLRTYSDKKSLDSEGRTLAKDVREGETEPAGAAKTETLKTKTMAESDEELRRRLEEMSGEGGASGIEFEDGKPVSMKRSVRNNMFRYI